jgi:hypothetical protein
MNYGILVPPWTTCGGGLIMEMTPSVKGCSFTKESRSITTGSKKVKNFDELY